MKIYDTFAFNDELEILEMRLNILDEVVDKFVIVEAPNDFYGNNKPFYFNLESLNYKNKDKILNIRLPFFNFGFSFYNDAFQKNMCYKSIENMLSDDDIFIYSDLDEIPNPEIIKEFKQKSPEIPWRLIQQFNHYYLNIRIPKVEWYGTYISKKKNLQNKYQNLSILELASMKEGIFGLRGPIGFPFTENIKNGGWHYTYFVNKTKGIFNIVDKLKNHTHTEVHDKANAEHVKNCIKNLSPLNPSTQPWELEIFDINELNTSKFILDNIENYQHLIYNKSQNL